MSKPNLRIGRTAVLIAMADAAEEAELLHLATAANFRVAIGKVGSMDVHKIIAAVETACQRSGLVDPRSYDEEHALYHAILEALQGIGRGQLAFGSILRTVGLRFAAVRGPRLPELPEPNGRDWIAVAMYGTIGAPTRGWEHEALGLGVNHL